VYLRSAAKPFIAAAIVASGAAERFGFDREDVALIAASHAGEDEHVRVARRILEKIGSDESALQCGAPPGRDAVRNNCSGKHAGILALCRMLDADAGAYLEPDHPAQRYILAFCVRWFGSEIATRPLAADGCGIPIFAAPLRNIAGAFARAAVERPGDLPEEDARAFAIVREAMLAHPRLVGGADRFDTNLMEAAGVLAKTGAEGVFGVSVLAAGVGLATKVVDGADRATPSAVTALLAELGFLDEKARERLRPFARREVRNVAGRVTGEITALLDTAE
jgi:L-asparaginase II